MNYTGERPTLSQEIMPSRKRYKSILPFCLNKRVYDYGCGIGHGTYFLSKFAQNVKGYDISYEAIDEAKKAFPEIPFSYIFFPEELVNFDILTIVEIIEHIEKEDVHNLLKNISQNIQTVVATTPNGDLFSYHPQSVSERRGFHIWHYTEDELNELFKKYFSFVEIYGDLRDPARSGTHASYTLYASNTPWKNSWLDELYF